VLLRFIPYSAAKAQFREGLRHAESWFNLGRVQASIEATASTPLSLLPEKD
jgi:hypothetical protein